MYIGKHTSSMDGMGYLFSLLRCRSWGGLNAMHWYDGGGIAWRAPPWNSGSHWDPYTMNLSLSTWEGSAYEIMSI